MGTRLNKPLIGITFALTATIIGAGQDATAKWLTESYALFQIIFLRSFVILGPMAIVLYRRQRWQGFSTRRPGAHCVRVCLHLLTFLPFYYALSRLPLGDVTALVMSAPLVMTLLSGPLLHEPVGPRRWFAVVVGFVGVILMVGELGTRVDALGVAAALVSTVFYCFWSIQTRRMSSTESSELMVFYGALGFLGISAVFMPSLWVDPQDGDWGLLLFLGLTGLGVNYFLAQAFRYAPIHVVAPFDYFYLVWAALLGYFIWQDIPSKITIFGAVLVVASGIYIFQRERQQHKKAKQPE